MSRSVWCEPDFPAPAPAAAASISTAITSAPAAASCMVLPPGAAHRSITRLPRTSPSMITGKVAAASCTHQPPSAKSPAALPPGPARVTRRDSAEQRRAVRRQSASAFFRLISSGRFVLMRQRDGAGTVFAILRRPALPQPVRRVQARRVQCWRAPLRLRWRSCAARH